MGKIVYLMGKSSSGKDTIFKELMKEGTMDLRTIVPYTTRPIRAGEENGVEYFFTDEAGFQALKGSVIAGTGIVLVRGASPFHHGVRDELIRPLVLLTCRLFRGQFIGYPIGDLIIGIIRNRIALMLYNLLFLFIL